MAGSEIDFVDNLLGQSFQIRNPERGRQLRLRHQLLDLTTLSCYPPPNRPKIRPSGWLERLWLRSWRNACEEDVKAEWDQRAKIATWNINGVKARIDNPQWLKI